MFFAHSVPSGCPCGYQGNVQHSCTCSLSMVQRYRTRFSGLLLDRIDLQVEVPCIPHSDQSDPLPAEASEMTRRRVELARNTRQGCFPKLGVHCNGRMGPKQLQAFCRADEAGQELLSRSPIGSVCRLAPIRACSRWPVRLPIPLAVKRSPSTTCKGDTVPFSRSSNSLICRGYNKR